MAPASAQLRVVSYNVHVAGDEVPTLEAIAEADGDLVLLQETTPAWERALRHRFAAAYPHMGFHHWRRAPGGLAALSRRPIELDELIPPAEAWFPAQRVIAQTAIGSVHLLHVHLRPAIDQGDWVRGFVTTPPIRRREIEVYWQTMQDESASALPRIIAGDFNEEPGATALAYLGGHGLARVDTGATPTWEWKGNYRNNDVHLRMKLDHILVDARLEVVAAHVVAGGGSDHQPVVVVLRPA